MITLEHSRKPSLSMHPTSVPVPPRVPFTLSFKPSPPPLPFSLSLSHTHPQPHRSNQPKQNPETLLTSSSMAEQHPRPQEHQGYQTQHQGFQYDDQQQPKGFLPQNGPSATHIVAMLTLVPIGGTLLFLSGLTLAGTILALAVSTPLFVIFSPILVPAALVIGLSVVGILTSGAFGITALSSFSWLARFLSRSRLSEKMGQKVQETTGYLGLKVQETAGYLGQKMQETGGQVGQKTRETGQNVDKAQDADRDQEGGRTKEGGRGREGVTVTIEP